MLTIHKSGGQRQPSYVVTKGKDLEKEGEWQVQLRIQHSPPDFSLLFSYFFPILKQIILSWGRCIKYNAHSDFCKIFQLFDKAVKWY